MSKIDKLRKRLYLKPKDFTYDEVKTLLESYGFVEKSKGKTSGSRVAFIRESDKKVFYLHKPHPQNIVKSYVIIELMNFINELSLEDEE